MTWGSGTWGSMYWGAPGDFASAMVKRLLMFVQGDPAFRGLTLALGNRTEKILTAARTVANAFDLDTAVGAQLDRIGGIVQRPRFGLADDRYRGLLRAHIDLILSSSGSAETLLAVFAAWTGAQATEYQEHYPAQFTIGGFVEPEEIAFLRSLLRQAKGWGILGGLSVAMAADNDLDGGTLIGDFVADEGLWSALIEGTVFAPTFEPLEDAALGAGTVVGNASYDPVLDCYAFDGSGDRLTWPTGPNLIGTDYTIECWVNADALATSISRLITTVWAGTSVSASLMLTSAGRVQLIRGTQAGTNMARASANATISTGQWYHIVATSPAGGFLNASLNRLWVNGREVASYAETTNGTGTERTTEGGLWIGGLVGAGADLDGRIAARPRIWPRVLSPAEIWHLYEEGVTSGAFAGPPDLSPTVDNPGVLDNVSAAIGGLAYELAHEVTL